MQLGVARLRLPHAHASVYRPRVGTRESGADRTAATPDHVAASFPLLKEAVKESGGGARGVGRGGVVWREGG